MSSVSEVLETVMKLTGGPAYAAQLQLAAGANDAVAAAEKRHEAVTGQLKGAFTELGGNAALLAGELAAVVAIGAEAVKTFAEEEQTIFRTTVVLRNLGNSFPIERAEELADSIRKTTAVTGAAVVGIIGIEKRFGIADNQIEKTTKTIVDFSKATGIGLEDAAEKVGRATLGQTRGLRALGIQMEDTGNKAQNLAIIQRKLQALFGGAGEAERNTVAGSFEALKASITELLEATGDKLSTVIVPVLNTLVKIIDYLTSHVYLFTAALGAIAGNAIGGPLGALIGGVLGLGAGFLPGRGNAAEAIGNGKGGLATEATLQQIEANTNKTADAFVKAVLGGSGVVARAAFTARDARVAFGI